MAERVLIIGSGGREDALKWKLSQSPHVLQVENIQFTTIENALNSARQHNSGLVIIGLEGPLALGIVDRFNAENIPVFGPTKEASRLEWDKAWAEEFMARHNIPHPQSSSFENFDQAIKYIQDREAVNTVIKVNGLSVGKGVILPSSLDEAKLALLEISQGKYGNQPMIIIQERLYGREVSLICLTDGTKIIPLLPAQDHKRLKDNDEGPNTGGMGAFTPADLEPDQQKQIINSIVNPTIQGLHKEGIEYTGALYFGLMLTNDGPKLLEYNSRFGDPETQPQMMLFSADLYLALKACVDRSLSPELVNFRQGASVCVVLAAEGYPQQPILKREIKGLDTVKDPNVQVFHSATEDKDGKIVTNGGRVLAVTAYGQSLEEARQKAYSQIGENGIHFEGMQYRKDIGVSQL